MEAMRLRRKETKEQPSDLPVTPRKKRREPASLKQKIMVPIILETVLSCLLMSIISYGAIRTLQQSKIKTAMTYDLHQISSNLSQSYMRLLQISQQMSTNDEIGSLVDQSFIVRDSFDKHALLQNISQTIGLVTFSNLSTQLVTYYDPARRTTRFETLPVRQNFAPETLPKLSESPVFQYQAPHKSESGCSTDLVISVTRRETFSNGESWDIYAEAKTDIENYTGQLSGEGSLNYQLLLLDRNGVVRYSSIPKTFAIGTHCEFLSGQGKTKDYVWESLESSIGFQAVIMMPASSYNRELYSLARNSLLISVLGIFTIALIGVMLARDIHGTLQQFAAEMKDLGHGDLNRNQHHTGIREFDSLFQTFNEMKAQIGRLAVENRKKEEEKHRIELDELTYRINPHFLMNALNSIHWLAVLHGQKEIDKFVSTLNRLLCYNLGKDGKPATLRTEIQLMRSYLDLQQMRYDFNAVFDVVPGEYLDRPCARFILQPIVENAVRHGLNENGTLLLRVQPDYTAQKVRILVQDDGEGMRRETLEKLSTNGHNGKGIGLRYVVSILKSYYGGKAQMHISSAEHEGTTVTIELPLEGRLLQDDKSADRG